MKFEQFVWQEQSGLEVVSNRTLQAEHATTVLFFGAISQLADSKAYQLLSNRYPNATIVGCSGGGAILNSELVDDAVVGYAIQFEKTSTRLKAVEFGEDADFELLGRELADELDATDLSAVIVFSESIGMNGSAVVRGMDFGFGRYVPIVGGLAMPTEDFSHSLVAANANARSNCIVGLGLYGQDVCISHASFHGCKPFGPIRQVTKSYKNIVRELDGKPAAPLFRSYLGDVGRSVSEAAMLFPLWVRPSLNSELGYNRTVVDIDDDNGSLICAGDIPEGAYAQLMRGSLDGLVKAAEDAAKEIFDSIDNVGSALAVLVSCVGRRAAHGVGIEAELEAARDALGEDFPAVGFYSHGEICPSSQVIENSFHNHTMTLFILSER